LATNIRLGKSTNSAVQPNVADLLAAGLAHYQAGRLADAEAHYQQALAAIIPGHGYALYLHCVIAHQGSRREQAIEFIGQVFSRMGDLLSGVSSL
jgi:tetratricopeptide (TPR) repeat protein